MTRPGWWAAAGAVLSLLTALALFDPRLFTGGDNAYYFALTEALATGQGYVDLIAPGRPAHAVYPPGFPLLLVPFHWLFGGAYVGLKAASWVAAGVALRGVWGLGRRDPAVPAWAAAAAVWLVGLYPVFLAYSHWVLSEMSFLAVSLGSLVAFERATTLENVDAVDIAPDRDAPLGWWLGGCLLAVAGFAIRTAGIALLAAPIVWALATRRWRRAGVAAVAGLLAAVPWLLWTARHAPATGGYLEQLRASNPYDPASAPLAAGAMLSRSWGNVVEYATGQLPLLVWPWGAPPPLVQAVGAVVLIALIVTGAWVAFRARGVRIWEVHLALSLALLALWPWTGDRFLLTVAPLLWLWALLGLGAGARAIADRPTGAVVLVGVVALNLLAGAIAKVPDQWSVTRAHMGGDELAGYDAFWSDYFEAARWIGIDAPDAVVLARKPTLAWYWSRRPSVVYPFRVDPEGTWRFVRERGVTHVLLDPLGSTRAYLTPALQRHLDAVQAVHAAPARNVYVLRVEPPS